MERCETCTHAHPTDIDGLIDCELDGRSKDDDMVCDEWSQRVECLKCEMEYDDAIQFAREFMSDDVHELAKIFRTENGTGHSD